MSVTAEPEDPPIRLRVLRLPTKQPKGCNTIYFLETPLDDVRVGWTERVFVTVLNDENKTTEAIRVDSKDAQSGRVKKITRKLSTYNARALEDAQAALTEQRAIVKPGVVDVQK